MKLLKFLDDYYEKVFIIFSFMIMLVAITIQVITRYFFSFTFSWSEELARICFVWVTLFAISLGAKQRQHLRVIAFLTFMPKKVRRVVEFLSVILTLLVLTIVVYKLIAIMGVQISMAQSTAAMGLPMGVMYIAGPLGLAGMVVRVVQYQLIPLMKGEEIYIQETHTQGVDND